MAGIQTCGQCQGTRFPEGMRLHQCPVCQALIHPGCWEAHVAVHSQRDNITAENLTPRRGIIGAYGIIQWDYQ
jgi:hypothetical protein